MEKVLRVMDIIPPFEGQRDPSNSGTSDVSHLSESEGLTRLGGAVPLDTPVERKSADESSVERRDEDVPSLDLGEKILAEQRRRTADTRRGPGMPRSAREPEPETRESERVVAASVDMFEADTAGHTELHDIVAEIVARDIERLCKGLKRASYSCTH